ESEDYHSDQLLSDINKLYKGYIEFESSFWDSIEQVDTEQRDGRTIHRIARDAVKQEIYPNQFFLDSTGFLARVINVDKQHLTLLHLDPEKMLTQDTWGLRPRDIYQAMALNLLLDPDIHLVNL